MPGRSLRTKLLAATLCLLVFLTAGALFTVRNFFGQQLRQQAVRETRIGSRVLGSIVERSAAQLLERGKVLTDLPSLQAAFTREKSQLEPLLLEVKAVRAANLLWATDPSGVVLASTGEYPQVGENLSAQPLLASALQGRPSIGFDLFGGSWWLVLSLPVQEQSSGKSSLGTVSLALLIGEAYLARLSELLGTQVGFVWGEHQLWSEGWPEEVRQLLSSQVVKGLTGTVQEVSLPEGKFIWLSRPVTGGDPPVATGPVAVLGIRLDESVIQHSSRIIAWIGLVTMLLGTVLLVGAIRSVTRPLKALVSDAHRIGAGDLTHRTRIRGDDELSELAAAFNQMVERLQASHQELAEMNRTLEERVQQKSRELEQAQAQLLQAEKLASVGQLAAGVAHELNNPLMVILGNTQLALRSLRQPDGPPAQTRQTEIVELLHDLEKQSHRARTIVLNLLDFVRVKPSRRVKSQIPTLLDESLRLVGHQASLQAIRVEKEFPPGLPEVLADPAQLQQVFVNVILNAVQAMPKGGTLTLRLRADGSHLTTAVQDTGMGIPEDQLAKVFDPFFTTKEVGQGTGLGLFVSYGIIQRHDGVIRISSKVSQGTTVTIQLPLPL